MKKYKAHRKDGIPILPGEAIIPIVKELEEGKLQVIGTGFYITRYGLFVTAKHVFEKIIDTKEGREQRWFVPHLGAEDKIYLRRIKGISYSLSCDIAVGQADNYCDKYPNNPLMNLIPTLSTRVPNIGDDVCTYGYPENKLMDFIDKTANREIVSDYYEGKFLRHTFPPENPKYNHPYYETSIHVKNAASGGPVFHNGKIIGINSSGLDYLAEDGTIKGHSFIIPIAELMNVETKLDHLPNTSFEYQQIPENKRMGIIKIIELVMYNHVMFNNKMFSNE